MTGLIRNRAIWTAAFALLACTAVNAATPDRQRQTKAAKSPQRIACGMTGCFEVPPGCRHEIRPNGYGIIAVVICDRR
jgi:hypothetical protein